MINPGQSLREVANLRKELLAYDYPEAKEALEDIDYTINMVATMIQGTLIDSKKIFAKLKSEHQYEVLTLEAKKMISYELTNGYGKKAHTKEVMRKVTKDVISDLQTAYDLCGKDCEALESILLGE